MEENMELIRDILINTAAKSKIEGRKVAACIFFFDDTYLAAYNYLSPNNIIVHAETSLIYKLNANKGSALRKVDPNYDGLVYVSHEPCLSCRSSLREKNLDYKVIEAFMKFDSDKLRYDLMPVKAYEDIVKILTQGAKKYKPNNWRNCEEPNRFLAAAMRHIEKHRLGNHFDDETGVLHLAHAATNLIFLIELYNERKNS